MLLYDLILRRAQELPTLTALIRGDQKLSYEELAEGVRRTAAVFCSLGAGPGDRIAVYLNKRFETVLSYFGSGFAGCVFVPINPSLKAAQVAHILTDCDVHTLVTTASQANYLRDVLPGCEALENLVVVDGNDAADYTVDGVRVETWEDLASAAVPAQQPVPRIDLDMAAILYTSGSTGRPKGVVLSHRNMVAGALSVAEYLENTPDDVLIAALPFSFDVGFSQLSTAFSVGASVVLIDYLLPRDVIKAASRHRATGLAGVPPLWAQLCKLDWPEDVVSSMRYVTNTGGAMPTATLGKIRERLPETTVYLMYGLTEAFRSTYLPPSELDRRPTSIGKAIPNAQILVVREDGTECEPGESGELVHRGALVSLGYWNDPERTALRFRPAPNQPQGLPFPEIAVYSGDTVTKDEDGFIYFVGRKDDMIKSSGYRISPTEIEEVIYGTNLVNECAALGIPHDELGQAIVLACFSDQAGEETRDALLDACKKTLPNYMTPTKIVFCDALPRNPNGKIDRGKLSNEYAETFGK